MHFKAIRTPLYPKNRVDPLFPCEGFAFNNHVARSMSPIP